MNSSNQVFKVHRRQFCQPLEEQLELFYELSMAVGNASPRNPQSLGALLHTWTKIHQQQLEFQTQLTHLLNEKRLPIQSGQLKKLYKQFDKLEKPGKSPEDKLPDNSEFLRYFRISPRCAYNCRRKGLVKCIIIQNCVFYRLSELRAYMMIFSALRYLDAGQLPHRIRCRDEDFKASLSMINVLLSHSIYTYTRIPDKKEVEILRLKLLRSLPPNFTPPNDHHLRAEVPQSTAYRILKLYFKRIAGDSEGA